MRAKLSLACLLLTTSTLSQAQEQARPEPSASKAATEHQPPAESTQPSGEKEAEASKWDVEHPRGLTLRKVALNTDEGTWMNVDVSPDGSRISFDMLGDIYVMPMSGGTPTRIA